VEKHERRKKKTRQAASISLRGGKKRKRNRATLRKSLSPCGKKEREKGGEAKLSISFSTDEEKEKEWSIVHPSGSSPTTEGVAAISCVFFLAGGKRRRAGPMR